MFNQHFINDPDWIVILLSMLILIVGLIIGIANSIFEIIIISSIGLLVYGFWSFKKFSENNETDDENE